MTDQDWLWLEKLHQHGPLSTSFLLLYAEGERRNRKRQQERLGDLFHEDNTAHDGAYMDRPPQQFATLKAGYNQVVHAVAKAGERALTERSLLHVGGASAGPWLHRHFVASVTASIELATRERSDVTFIPQHRILERADTALRVPIETVHPESGEKTLKDLIPDALFGLQYHSGDGNQFRFYVVEVDRSTEPVSSRNWNRKSWERHLAQYHAYIAEGRYKDHLGLKAPLMVLNVVPDDTRLELLRRATKTRFGSCTYQLFQSYSDFAQPWQPSSPNYALLNGSWKTTDAPFCIDQP